MNAFGAGHVRTLAVSIGWICALFAELAASKSMLDEIHSTSSEPDDTNQYVRGKIGGHYVVIACLPAGQYGIGSAARCATNMKRSFHSLEWGLLVGIGGAVPSSKHNINLGDVVVSQPTQDHGGLIQYDMGKTLASGLFERRGALNKPPTVLLSAVNTLRAEHELNGTNISKHLSTAYERFPYMREKYQRPISDQLDDPIFCPKFVDSGPPAVHYGLIASGNKVISNAEARNHLAEKDDILCFEMEAAGLDDFPCLVIRGISDFADEKKDDDWQRPAAAAAAAYAKELLLSIPTSRSQRPLSYEHDDSLGSSSRQRALLSHPDSSRKLNNKTTNNTNEVALTKNTTFRICNIPGSITQLKLASFISSLEELSIDEKDIKILSLAKSANSYETSPTKVATARFKRIPTVLKNGENEWMFRPDKIYKAKKDLVFDVHFHGFTPLADSPEEAHTIDCIAIAGIGHHPYDSWTAFDSQKFMYLRDQAPKELPFLRPLIYGFEREMLLHSTIMEMSKLLAVDLKALRPGSLASRPKAFLAHSLSGIILKYALIDIANSAEFEKSHREKFLSGILAIVSFGVPTEGVALSNLMAMSRCLAPVKLVRNFCSKDELKSLESQFKGTATLRGVELFAAYEYHESNIAEADKNGDWALSASKGILVSNSSSESNNIPLRGDHHSIIRFGEGDTSCQWVTGSLRKVAGFIQVSHDSMSLKSWGSSSAEPLNTGQRLSEPLELSHLEALHPTLPQFSLKEWPSRHEHQKHLRQLMMRSLRIEDDNLRYKRISEASGSTFEWAFSPNQCGLLEWLESGTGVFWITGRPGSGKSTFMKFIFEHQTTQSVLDKHACRQKIVKAHFFFYGRGSHAQRSFEGLLQSIIRQLLHESPALQQCVEPIFKKRALTDWELWSLHELEEAFENICQNRLSIRIFLFLDALDEYSGSKSTLCDFIKRHSNRSNNSCICFSSRPWMVFEDQFRAHPKLRMHELTHLDVSKLIADIIQNRPPLLELCAIGGGNQAARSQMLRHRIEERANGVFLWIVLVLDVLEKRTHDGLEFDGALKVVDELPTELYEFYHQIMKGIPQEYRQEAYIIFEIILRANSAIDLELIQNALLLARTSSFQQCVDNDSASSNRVRAGSLQSAGNNGPSPLERKISSRCGGLVEIVTSDSSECLADQRQVQFMHHTVFEYFRVFPASNSQYLVNETTARDLGTGHSILTKIFSAHLAKRARIDSIVPNLILHAEESEKTTGMSQKAFLESIPPQYIKRFLDYLFESESFGASTRKFPKLRDTTVFAIAACLQLALLEGLEVKTIPNVPPIDNAGEIFTALPHIFHSTATRFKSLRRHDSIFHFTKTLIKRFNIGCPGPISNDCFATCFSLILQDKRRSFSPMQTNENHGCNAIIEALLSQGQPPNQCIPLHIRKTKIFDTKKMQWVFRASTTTALHIAALCGAQSLIPRLLERGANVNAKDDIGRTPLDWALTNSNYGEYLHCFWFQVDTAPDPPPDPHPDEDMMRKHFPLGFCQISDLNDQIISELSRVRNWRFVEANASQHELILLLKERGAIITTSKDEAGNCPILDQGIKGWRWRLPDRLSVHSQNYNY